MEQLIIAPHEHGRPPVHYDQLAFNLEDINSSELKKYAEHFFNLLLAGDMDAIMLIDDVFSPDCEDQYNDHILYATIRCIDGSTWELREDFERGGYVRVMSPEGDCEFKVYPSVLLKACSILYSKLDRVDSSYGRQQSSFGDNAVYDLPPEYIDLTVIDDGVPQHSVAGSRCIAASVMLASQAFLSVTSNVSQSISIDTIGSEIAREQSTEHSRTGFENQITEKAREKYHSSQARTEEAHSVDSDAGLGATVEVMPKIVQPKENDESTSATPDQSIEKKIDYELFSSSELARMLLDRYQNGRVTIPKAYAKEVIHDIQDIIDDEKGVTFNDKTKEKRLVDANPLLFRLLLRAVDEGFVPRLTIIDHRNHSKNSDHWKLNAIDLGLKDWDYKGFYKWAFENQKELGIEKLILHPEMLPEDTHAVLRGKNHTYSHSVNAQHRNHIHISFTEPHGQKSVCIEGCKTEQSSVPEKDPNISQVDSAIRWTYSVSRPELIKTSAQFTARVEHPGPGKRGQDEALSSEEIEWLRGASDDDYLRVALGGQTIKVNSETFGTKEDNVVKFEHVRSLHQAYVLDKGGSVLEFLNELSRQEVQRRVASRTRPTSFQNEVIDELKISEKQKEFIRAIVLAIQRAIVEGAEINAEVALAQAALESGYGKRMKGNNVLGIKSGSSWGGKTVDFVTHEVIRGKRIKVTDRFRAYSTISDSIRDYAHTIGKKAHWKDAQKCFSQPLEYVRGLQHELDNKCIVVNRFGENGVLSYSTEAEYPRKVQVMRKFLNTSQLFYGKDAKKY